MENNNIGLYALCANDDHSIIKIGKITGNITGLMNQYSTRYHSQGFKLLRYWNGREYYVIEQEVINHNILAPSRICNETTGKSTEWFRTTLNIIDNVVFIVISGRRNNIRASLTLNIITDPVTKNTDESVVKRANDPQQPISLNIIIEPRKSEVVDMYEKFISDVCVLGDDKYISSAKMYEYYKIYCGLASDSNKAFVKKMQTKFMRKRKGAGGPFCYLGIGVDVEKFNATITSRNK